MKSDNKKIAAFFFAGFFAKDIIDDIFFLAKDKYPITVYGFKITATHHKIMLVVSTTLTALLLMYGLRKRKGTIIFKMN